VTTQHGRNRGFDTGLSDARLQSRFSPKFTQPVGALKWQSSAVLSLPQALTTKGESSVQTVQSRPERPSGGSEPLNGLGSVDLGE
jgi:hypothetical protein